jgi:hypothetical protein
MIKFAKNFALGQNAFHAPQNLEKQVLSSKLVIIHEVFKEIEN